jgi:hypothetical protein
MAGKNIILETITTLAVTELVLCQAFGLTVIVDQVLRV